MDDKKKEHLIQELSRIDDDAKTKRVAVRMTENHLDVFEAVAKLEDMTFSTWARQCMRERAFRFLKPGKR